MINYYSTDKEILLKYTKYLQLSSEKKIFKCILYIFSLDNLFFVNVVWLYIHKFILNWERKMWKKEKKEKRKSLKKISIYNLFSYNHSIFYAGFYLQTIFLVGSCYSCCCCYYSFCFIAKDAILCWISGLYERIVNFF